MGQLVFQATLGGQVALVGPNTASSYSLNIPAVSGNVVTTGDTGTVTNTMLANSSITFGSTAQALGSTITAINGVAIGGGTAGSGAFTTLTSTSDATLHGVTVGQGAGSVSTNTAVGASALSSNTTGNNNSAFGVQALLNNTTGINNIAIGNYSLITNTIGSQNTAVGYLTLNKNTASQNTAVGYSALFNNTTGTPNDAFGYQALTNNTTGVGNVGIGYSSLGANTTGTNNTAIGTQALTNNTIGQYSTAIGWNALYSNTANANTGMGNQVGAGVTTGINNTLVGAYAGYSGTNNLTTGTGNVLVGYNVAVSTSGAINQIVIGAASTGKGNNTAFVNGSSGAYNGANSTLWAVTSDERIKENVVPLPSSLPIINALNPISFDYIEDKTSDVGFIAQEYQKVLPNQIIETAASPAEQEFAGTDTLLGIQQNLTPYLVKAVQELSAQVTTLQAQVAALTPASGTPSA